MITPDLAIAAKLYYHDLQTSRTRRDRQLPGAN
jgi:hypothetical protein